MSVTVTGTYVDASGPLIGKTITFQQDPATVTLAGSILVNDAITVTLDLNGSFTVNLPDTDTGNPAGWTYLVQENFGNFRRYHINIPVAGSHDMKDLAPVSINAGVANFVGPTGQQGLSYALGAWQNFAFPANAASAGGVFYPAQARLEGVDVVRFRGGILLSAAWSSNLLYATLPAGLRPASAAKVPTRTTGAGASIPMTIGADGTLKTPVAIANGDTVNLDGITFTLV